MSHRLPNQARILAHGSVLAALLLAGIPLRAAETPNFSGTWKLNPSLSDDFRAQVEAGAGPADVKGAKGVLLPRAGTGSEVDRVRLRQFLLDGAGGVETEEIEQSQAEIKLVHGEENVRIFYFGREHVRNDARGGKLRCRTRWQDQQLVIEEESDTKTRIVDLLTLVPARKQLIHVIHLEATALPQPLELRLVYDRAPEAEKAR